MAIDMATIMQLVPLFCGEVNEEAVALQVETLVRRRGGDPVAVWSTLLDLGEARLAALGAPRAGRPAVECERCTKCGKLALTSATGVDLSSGEEGP